jgi:hypothetical protein
MKKKIFTMGFAALLLSLAIGFAATQSHQTHARTATASQIAPTGGSPGIRTVGPGFSVYASSAATSSGGLTALVKLSTPKPPSARVGFRLIMR